VIHAHSSVASNGTGRAEDLEKGGLGVTATIPSQVLIREVGPREGFQIMTKVVETARKVELIAALVDAGLSHVEVTSFMRQDRVPQMADAESLVQSLVAKAGVHYTGLYLNIAGFKRAQATGRLDLPGWLYTSPSDSFLRRNNNSTIEKTLESVPEWVAAFREAGRGVHGLMVSTAFGCELEGSVSVSSVTTLVERFIAECDKQGEHLKEVCLADTVGRGQPTAIREAVRLIRSLGVVPSLHLHDTWGLGLTNAYAGLLEGVEIFEASVGGMGGCPFTPGAAGNVATEDLVYLCESLGIATGIDLERCCAAAVLAEKIVGSPLPGRVYRARRAFCDLS
jgi:hydroxymethylglutaryl-CoA lyase